RAGLVHDLAHAVGGEVHQHVQNPALALAATGVDVRGVHARAHATGVHGDREGLGTGAVGDAGRPGRDAEAGALGGELQRGQRQRRGRCAVVQVRARADDLTAGGPGLGHGAVVDDYAAVVGDGAVEGAVQGGAGLATPIGGQRAELGQDVAVTVQQPDKV